jgi:hypothetical protein
MVRWHIEALQMTMNNLLVDSRRVTTMSTNKLSLLLCGLMLATSAYAGEWKSHDVGSPPTPGSSVIHTDAITLTGSGAGMRWEANQPDQCQFVAMPIPAGDVEFTARVTLPRNAPNDARVGLMLRAGANPFGATAPAVSFGLRQTRSGRQRSVAVEYFTKEPVGDTRDNTHRAAGAWVESLGSDAGQPASLWLRITRIGSSFVVRKSADGRIWSSMGNKSGGVFGAPGELQMGFYVAGPTATTATISNIFRTPNPVKLPYTTSWYGATHSGAVGAGQTPAMEGLYVTPDGRCFTNTTWNEIGSEIAVSRGGQVEALIPCGTSGTVTIEGGGGRAIAVDGNDLYFVGMHELEVGGVVRWNMGQSFNDMEDILLNGDATRPAGSNRIAVEGLAVAWDKHAGGKRLFVSDSRNDVIRKTLLTRDHTVESQSAGFNSAVTRIRSKLVKAGAAPRDVYTTRRGNGDWLVYKLDGRAGIRAGATYTVRAYFCRDVIGPGHADAAGVSADQKTITWSVGDGSPYDFNLTTHVELTSPYVGYDSELSGKTVTSGTMYLALQSPTAHQNLPFKGPGASICGFQVFEHASPGVTRLVYGVNCGGPALPGFAPESHEVDSFPFARPGPLVNVVGLNGQEDLLWIIQRDNPGAFVSYEDPRYRASTIVCMTTGGQYVSHISAADPGSHHGFTALAYDRNAGQLLVADNGTNQNIRIYDIRDPGHPKLKTTFGIAKGIYAGANPGQLVDPNAGGTARHFGLVGVGVDDSGAITVLSRQGPVGMLRCFRPSANNPVKWQMTYTEFVTTPCIDPESELRRRDGAVDVYGAFHHAVLDLNHSTVGGRWGAGWTIQSVTWNPFRFGSSEFASTLRLPGWGVGLGPYVMQTQFRHVGPANNRVPMMLMTGQGAPLPMCLYRMVGETAVPFAWLHPYTTGWWLDGNGDGRESRNEFTAPADANQGKLGSVTGVHLDQKGDIWLATGAGDQLGHLNYPGAVRRIPFLRISAHGVPVHDWAHPQDFPLPHPWGVLNINDGWHDDGGLTQVVYDSQTDVLYVSGPMNRRDKTSTERPQYAARYDRWVQDARLPRARTATWAIQLPVPSRDAIASGSGSIKYPHQYRGFAHAGGKLFIPELFGQVLMIDAATGAIEQTLSQGPERNGHGAWQDSALGIKAYQRPSGEIIVMVENGGADNAIMMYRIPKR